MQDAAVLGTRVLFGVLRAACWVLWNAMGSVAGSSESGVGVALADKAESRSSGAIQTAGRGKGVVLHVVSVQYRIGTHLRWYAMLESRERMPRTRGALGR